MSVGRGPGRRRVDHCLVAGGNGGSVGGKVEGCHDDDDMAEDDEEDSTMEKSVSDCI